MKTLTSLLVAAFVFLTNVSFAQENKTAFERASLTKGVDGTVRVQLNWRKGAENTTYYQVERSIDGKAFKTVAVVFTSEDGKLTAYKYSDKSVGTSGNAVYYRIAIVSEQNEVAYLPVQRVELSSAATTFVDPVEGAFGSAK